jgi:glutathione peroxidase
MNDPLLDIPCATLDGQTVTPGEYGARALLVVNTASKCGFTPQYDGLEKLYQAYKDRGFEVLGFPCNQFGSQEPGNEAEIATFCSTTYPVTFPMFRKVEVNGDQADPLWQQLKEQAPGLLGTQAVKWNFTKFLVNRDGLPVERFAPRVKPEDIAPRIAKLLA